MGIGEQGVWSEKDRLLLVALTLHEQGVCSGCGQPRSIGHDIANHAGEFDVHTDVCQGCEALETHREHETQTPRGQKVYVIHATD